MPMNQSQEESEHSKGGTTSSGKMGVAMPISGATAVGNGQRVGDTTRQSHHSDGSSSQGGETDSATTAV